MRAVVTRVSEASVRADGEVTGAIGTGFLVLLGITHGDTEAQAERLADKLCSLRVFEDENGKMNRSLADAGGSLLVVSQFTLYGDCSHGRRPSFIAAARPEAAAPLYEFFLRVCGRLGFPPETGVFGAEMAVASVNDGPV
ncbi:MAG TPA: D-aminoacyl-tRNA deacylase, partial [Oscillospiraceae bacterium]|nr:D-aminoacyl-tRNA deacylase [Oscillospiraceae bacterium]